MDPEHDTPGQHPVLKDLQQGKVRAGPRRMRSGGGSQDLDWRRSDRDWREGTLLWQKKSQVSKFLLREFILDAAKLSNDDILTNL